MKSIFLRYFFMLAIIILVSFMSLGVFFIIASATALTEQRFNDLSRIADELVPITSEFAANKEEKYTEYYNSISMLSAAADAHVMFVSNDGVIEICSNARLDDHKGVQLDAELIEAIQSIDVYTIVKIKILSDDLQNIIVRQIHAGDRFLGTVVVNSSAEMEGRLLSTFMRIFFLVSMIVLFIAFCSAYATSRSMARPLRDMAKCAHDFAHGDFTIRVNRWILRDDEIGELACAFNAMADALDKSELLRRGFIANVSHELKTPMTIIAGYIGGLLDGTIPSERQEETLSLVREDVWRLSRMVTSMTELSRLQSGQIPVKLKTFDICELSVRVLVGLEPKISEKDLQVSIHIPEDELLLVSADEDLTVQVLTNLIDNAIKFSSKGGEIVLSIIRRSPKAQVSIRNTGDVIPAEELPYIFDRYHKADHSRSCDRTGLGLGLYLVQSIINAHKENIHVISENGVTEFTFTLPEAKK